MEDEKLSEHGASSKGFRFVLKGDGQVREDEKSWNGPERRLSNGSLDRLEIEIHREKVRVWVDGATNFLADAENQKIFVSLIIKALDEWLRINRKLLLERLGLYAFGAMLLTLLGVLGWKGWGGK